MANDNILWIFRFAVAAFLVCEVTLTDREKEAPIMVKVSSGDYGIDAVLPDGIDFKKYIGTAHNLIHGADNDGPTKSNSQSAITPNHTGLRQPSGRTMSKNHTLTDVAFMKLLRRREKLRDILDKVKTVSIDNGSGVLTREQFRKLIGGEESVQDEGDNVGDIAPSNETSPATIVTLDASQYAALGERITQTFLDRMHIYSFLIQLIAFAVLAVLVCLIIYYAMRHRRRSQYTIQ